MDEVDFLAADFADRLLGRLLGGFFLAVDAFAATLDLLDLLLD